MGGFLLIAASLLVERLSLMVGATAARRGLNGRGPGIDWLDARLQERNRQRGRELASLLRVSRAASSSLELSTVLSEIAQATIGVASIEAASVELWDRQSNELVVRAQAAVPDWPGVHPVGTRFGVDRWPLNREALRGRAPVHVTVDSPELSDGARRMLSSLGVGSAVLFPLLAGDEVFGLLKAFARGNHAFRADDIRLGVEISNQTALAVRNAQQLRAERNRANEWAVLHRVSRAATSSLDLETVLAEIAQACLGIAGTEACTISSWDETTGELVIQADVTVPDWPGVEQPGSRHPLVPGAAGRLAMAERRPIIVRRSDPDLVAEDRGMLEEHGIESMLTIPFSSSGSPAGLIYLCSRDASAFDADAIRLGAEIAAQTALATQNARLLDESRRYADEQSALLRVSRAISRGCGLAEVMNEVAAASLAIAGAECCEIELLRPGAEATEIVGAQHSPGWTRGHTAMGKTLPLADWPVTRRILATQKPEILDGGSPCLTDQERAKLFAASTESALFVPMVVDGRAVGIMCCYSAVPHAFSEDSVRLGSDLAGQAALAIERSRLQAALEKQANTDDLTDVLNHRAIHERLDEELARACREEMSLAILMVDLNRFKIVNDTYGH